MLVLLEALGRLPEVLSRRQPLIWTISCLSLVISGHDSLVKCHRQLAHLVLELHVLLSEIMHMLEVLVVMLSRWLLVDYRVAGQTDRPSFLCVEIISRRFIAYLVALADQRFRIAS